MIKLGIVTNQGACRSFACKVAPATQHNNNTTPKQHNNTTTARHSLIQKADSPALVGDEIGLLVKPLQALRAAVLALGVVGDRVPRKLARDLEPLVAHRTLVVVRLVHERAVGMCLLVPLCAVSEGEGAGKRG